MLDDALKDQKKSANRLYINIGKGLLIIVGVALVLMAGKSLIDFPTKKEGAIRETNEKKARETVEQTEETKAATNDNNRQNEEARELFKRALSDFEQQYASLINNEALVRWAPDETRQAQATFDKAVRAFANSYYVDALNHIETADAEARLVIARWDRAFDDAFTQAQQAFDQNESRNADLFLTRALTLKPDNAEALALRQRLSLLPDIEQLLEDARVAKIENSVEREAEAIRKIIRLDPARKRLAERLAHLQEAIKLSKYKRYIAAGMAAVNSNQLVDATRQLTQAKQLYPNKREIGVLEREIAAKTATSRRQTWLAEINTLINNDNWGKVLTFAEEARKAFPIDKAFADYGALARDIVSRTQRIDRYLSQPDRLKDGGVHANAATFANATRNAAQHSLGLTLKLEQLNAVLETFAKPVPVLVKSDGKTNIIVIGTGKIGITRAKEIALKPGTYVFEGSRKGYRNVRVTLTVDSLAKNQEVTVMCSERI